MDSLSLMDVKSVSVRRIKHFPATEDGGHEFYSREIVITQLDGKRMAITMYADMHEELMLLDGAREPIERIPDPPDCSACGGSGRKHLPIGEPSRECPACNGEGVAQF